MVNEESGVFHQTHLLTLIFLTAFGSRVRDRETVCVCVMGCLFMFRYENMVVFSEDQHKQFPIATSPNTSSVSIRTIVNMYVHFVLFKITY